MRTFFQLVEHNCCYIVLSYDLIVWFSLYAMLLCLHILSTCIFLMILKQSFCQNIMFGYAMPSVLNLFVLLIMSEVGS